MNFRSVMLSKQKKKNQNKKNKKNKKKNQKKQNQTNKHKQTNKLRGQGLLVFYLGMCFTKS